MRKSEIERTKCIRVSEDFHYNLRIIAASRDENIQKVLEDIAGSLLEQEVKRLAKVWTLGD